MPLYKVHLIQRVIETGSFTIEADSPEHAVDAAMAASNKGEIEWNFYEAPEPPTVEEIKEL